MNRPLPRSARLAAPLALAVALAGCGTGPRPPLYSSAQATGSFGYHEEQLGDWRYRVGYRAPIRRAYSLSRAEREREAERLTGLSYDLALMRAAELAVAQGAPSFDIAERENNIETVVEDGYAYDPFFYPAPYWRYPYVPWAPYPYPAFADPHTEIAVDVTFLATLRPQDGSGAFDSRATLERLRAKYPNATQPTGT